MGGNVTWVPRVNRARDQLCNAQPTFAKGQGGTTTTAPTTQAAQRTAANTTVEVLVPKPDGPQATSSAAAVASVAPGTAPATATVASLQRQAAVQPQQAAPRPVTRLQPAQMQTQPRAMGRQPMPTIAGNLPDPMAPTQRTRVLAPDSRLATIAPAPGMRATQMRAPAPAVADNAVRVAAGSAREDGCRWASDISAQYMRGTGVRCGPQKDTPARITRVLQAPNLQANAGHAMHAPRPAELRDATGPRIFGSRTRIAPRHVWAAQRQVADLGPVPAGYRPVWEDDRLNPNRAHQTLDGKRKMELRWTRDVPYRLIDMTTGADVTAFHPDLVHPAVAAQQAKPHMSTRNGAASTQMERLLAEARHERGHLADHGSAGSRGVISTRSTPRALPQGASSRAVLVGVSHRYVQVGVYGSPAQAQSAAAKLQRAGLQMRLNATQQGTVLLAGPYGTTQQLGNALYAVRQSGYPAAFTRK